MVDYSKLSDFEINSAVHNALLSEPYSMLFMGNDRIEWTSKDGRKIVTDRVPYTKNGVHDYCNNPADAWPIIVGKQISLISRCANDEWKAQLHLVRNDIFDSYDSCWDKNPLRAAMIVFLMMQDTQNG